VGVASASHTTWTQLKLIVNRLTMFGLVPIVTHQKVIRVDHFSEVFVLFQVEMQLTYFKSLSAQQCQHICVPSRTPCGPDAPLGIALLSPKSLGQPNAYLSAPAPN